MLGRVGPAQARLATDPAAPDAAEDPSRRLSGAASDQETKYVAHIMPWFDAGSSITGSHWCDPAFGGSFYESVFGLYSSKDPALIRKQLLLMKAAGIDGVWIDLQFTEWLEAIHAIIHEVNRLDMHFAIVIDNYARATIVEDVKADLRVWMEMPSYYRVFGRPVLPYFEHKDRQGTTVLPDWHTTDGHQPYVIGTYMVHPDGLPVGYDSLFFWNSPDLKWLETYYNSLDFTVKVGAIYRGWHEAYTDRHHTPPYMGYMGRTLEMAQEFKPYFAQIATWNDYAEGTMVEPSFLRDVSRGGCGDPKEAYWASSSKACSSLFELKLFTDGGSIGACLPGVASRGGIDGPCSGSGSATCGNVTDCTKPLDSVEGPAPPECPAGNRTAYGDLAAIAWAVRGTPLVNATATFEAILDGWEPEEPAVPMSAAAGLPPLVGLARLVAFVAAAASAAGAAWR